MRFESSNINVIIGIHVFMQRSQLVIVDKIASSVVSRLGSSQKKVGMMLMATTLVVAVIKVILLNGLIPAQFFSLVGVCLFQLLAIRWPSILARITPILNVENASSRTFLRISIRAAGLILPLVWLFMPLWFASLICVLLFVIYASYVVFYISKKNSSIEDYLNLSPSIIVYIAGSKQISYQVNQWILVLEKMDADVAIISRNLLATDTILPTKIPIFYCRRFVDLEFFCENGPSTILYPGNPVKNIHALRQTGLEHIFINHGESDKVVNQSKVLMAYDKILVAGSMAEQRMKDAGLPLRPGQVIHVGRPQAEMILDKIFKPVTQIKNVLYAPTWEGFLAEADYSSVSEFGYNILSQLSEDDDIQIKFKPHPFTGKAKPESKYWLKKILQLCSDKGITVLNHDESLYDAMNWSDLLVSDVSSVLNDYLVTSKPIILCNSQSQDIPNLELTAPSSKGAYVLEKEANIVPLIESIAVEDSNWSLRLDTRIKSLGKPTEDSFKLFESAVLGRD